MTHITVLDVAKARGVKEDDRGCINASEFERVGLPVIGGCACCQATIAAYNAAPTKTGYLMCAEECAEGRGFETVEEFEEWSREQDEKVNKEN